MKKIHIIFGLLAGFLIISSQVVLADSCGPDLAPSQSSQRICDCLKASNSNPCVEYSSSIEIPPGPKRIAEIQIFDMAGFARELGVRAATGNNSSARSSECENSEGDMFWGCRVSAKYNNAGKIASVKVSSQSERSGESEVGDVGDKFQISNLSDFEEQYPGIVVAYQSRAGQEGVTAAQNLVNSFSSVKFSAQEVDAAVDQSCPNGSCTQLFWDSSQLGGGDQDESEIEQGNASE